MVNGHPASCVGLGEPSSPGAASAGERLRASRPGRLPAQPRDAAGTRREAGRWDPLGPCPRELRGRHPGGRPGGRACPGHPPTPGVCVLFSHQDWPLALGPSPARGHPRAPPPAHGEPLFRTSRVLRCWVEVSTQGPASGLPDRRQPGRGQARPSARNWLTLSSSRNTVPSLSRCAFVSTRQLPSAEMSLPLPAPWGLRSGSSGHTLCGPGRPGRGTRWTPLGASASLWPPSQHRTGAERGVWAEPPSSRGPCSGGSRAWWTGAAV